MDVELLFDRLKKLEERMALVLAQLEAENDESTS